MRIRFLRRPNASPLYSVVLLGLLLSSRLAAEQPAPAPPPAEPLRLYVFGEGQEGLISGATVRVLSRAGKVLTETTTDESGVAVLPQVPAAADPWMILVEHKAFYIGGILWRPGYLSRCVHLAIGRTC